jgi:allantoin racemase
MTYSSMGAPRRVLVINPNTNPLVTTRVMAVCERYANSRLQFDVVNPTSGPFSIESDADKREAEAQVVRLMSERASEGHDAYVLACFDDLGLAAARQIVPRPVIGCCEAGISAARAVSPALAIVTTVTAALPGIRSMMQRYGAGEQATVRAAGVGVDEAARAQPDVQARLTRAIEDAVQVDGAQVILLASGGLTGQAAVFGRDAGVPVIDAVEAALCEAAQVTPLGCL